MCYRPRSRKKIRLARVLACEGRRRVCGRGEGEGGEKCPDGSPVGGGGGGARGGRERTEVRRHTAREEEGAASRVRAMGGGACAGGEEERGRM